MNWKNVRTWGMYLGEEIEGDYRIKALAEFRATGSIVGIVLADPAEYSDVEDLCDAGPDADEIDWTDFDKEVWGNLMYQAEHLGYVVKRDSIILSNSAYLSKVADDTNTILVVEERDEYDFVEYLVPTGSTIQTVVEGLGK